MNTVDIIGGGIGGLTTALALEKKGFQVRIFEQAEKLKPVGGGIIMANNAMQVLEKLGVHEEIQNTGNAISTMKVVDKKLKSISKIELKNFEKKYGLQNIAIHRALLQQILLNNLKHTKVHFDHQLKDIKRTENDDFNLSFKNGKSLKSELLIGADGIHSKVRQELFNKGTLRNTKQTCWRGVADFELSEDFANELNEVWGLGDRFGFVKIAKGKVYWFAVKSFKADEKELKDENLNDYFADYPEIVKSVLENTPKHSIHTTVIKDLKPIHTWVNTNVCLLGDAAHATTPNLGQGACQSIEDAFVLAEYLSKYEPNKAFKAYEKLRFSKANLVVKRSWNIGKLAHWEQPLASKIRNFMLRTTPDAVNQKLTAKIFQLQNI